MKVFITGINWTLWANKNGSNNMNEFFYQLTHKDGRTSEMFKITGAMDIMLKSKNKDEHTIEDCKMCEHKHTCSKSKLRNDN